MNVIPMSCIMLLSWPLSAQDAMLCSFTSSMTRAVGKEELPKVDGTVPTHRTGPASNKRKHSAGELEQQAYYTTISFHGSPLSTLSVASKLCISAENATLLLHALLSLANPAADMK